MPVPYRVFQTVPKCPDNWGWNVGPIGGGSLDIDSSCCQTYGNNVYVRISAGLTRGLAFQSGPGPAIYSGNTWRLCGGNGAAFDGLHNGTGTISGSDFTGSGGGSLSGGRSGSYNIFLSGTFSSPGNGTFTGSLTGALTGTLVGTIAGGAITSVTYTITSPTGVTVTHTGAAFLITSPTAFAFSGSFSGNNPPPVTVYFRLTWTHCNAGGILLEMFWDDDDSLIATWENTHYSLRRSVGTILMQTYVRCDHPCMTEAGELQKHALVRPGTVLCFSPTNTPL